MDGYNSHWVERDRGKGWNTMERRVTSVAEQPLLVPLNPSSSPISAKALCQNVTTRDSTMQLPMGHHYPDLAARGYDSISYALPGYTPSFVQFSFICAKKRGNAAWPVNWHVWEAPSFYSFTPLPRCSSQCDYVTRRRAIVLSVRCERANISTRTCFRSFFLWFDTDERIFPPCYIVRT